MHTKIKSKLTFLRYAIMYVRVPYYTKIKSKCKFKIRNIKLSKISLPTVYQTIASDVDWQLVRPTYLFKQNFSFCGSS